MKVKRVVGALLVALCAVFAASADVLVYDGVPLSDSAYGTPIAAGSNLAVYASITDSSMIGFTGKFLNTGTGTVKAFSEGLSYPDCFTATAIGGSWGLKTASSNLESNGRLQYRALETDVLPVDAGTLYVRVLIRSETGASGALKANCYHGVGLGQTKPSATNGGADNDTLADGSGYNLTRDGLYFAFKKDATGSGFAVVLRVKDHPDYVLVPNAQGSTTYLCVAEIKIAAGAGGKERVRAFAIPTADYVAGTAPYAATVGTEGIAESELLGSGATLSYAIFGGVYLTANKLVNFDEFMIATSLLDVLPTGVEALRLDSATVNKDADGFFVTATLAAGTGELVALVKAEDGTVITSQITASAVPGVPYTGALEGLESDMTYNVTVVAREGILEDTQFAGTIYTGDVWLEWVNDAQEEGLIPGTVQVCRSNASGAISVTYSFTGLTAVEGVNYAAPVGTVTIPAGETSALIQVEPLIDGNSQNDTTLAVALMEGPYFIAGDAVEVTVHNFDYPADYNIWISQELTGDASDANGWSFGRVPAATDKIWLSGYSPCTSLVWNAGVNGLSDTVAEWNQQSSFTGTVVFATQYPTVDGATFTQFNVTGDVNLQGGVWTHMSNRAFTDNTYRLYVEVGGNVTVGSNAKISTKGYGRKGNPTNGQGPYLAAYGGYAYCEKETRTSAFGSMLEPVDCAQWVYLGSQYFYAGGAVRLSVAGDLVVDGSIDSDSNGGGSSYAAAPGGSVWINAKSVSGAGTISADGARGGKTDGPSGAGSGGRIAVYTVEDLTMPVEKITAYGEGVSASSTISSGAGTVFLKSSAQTYGTLVVNSPLNSRNYGTGIYPPGGVAGLTPVMPGETWTFDSVILGGVGRLAVPAGTTLSLPNGLASVRSLDSARMCSIRVEEGGVLQLPPGKQTIRSGWMFNPAGAYSFNGDVDVVESGGIGLPKTYQTFAAGVGTVDITVHGDLYVDATSCLSVEEALHTLPNTTYGGAAHGGRSGYTKASAITYDSVFNPLMYGASWDASSYAGGLIKATVTGTLQLDGIASARGAADNSTAGVSGERCVGSAGSINITAGRLVGKGSMTVMGSLAYSGNYLGASAGGRIAIRLTHPEATFEGSDVPTFVANGRTRSQSSSYATGSSSAGTIYLQAGNQQERAGTIIIRNDNNANNPLTTPVPALGVGGDTPNSLVYATLVLENRAIAELTVGFALERLVINENTKLDLAGKRLRAVSAFVNGTKLGLGQYTAADLPASLSDSSGGGVLIVGGTKPLITIY